MIALQGLQSVLTATENSIRLLSTKKIVLWQSG